MSNISRVSLFAKLNPVAFKSVEGATVLCKLRGNPYVQLVHWVAQILQQDDSDWHHVLRYFELDANAVLADVQRALERQPGGAQGISDLSESITNAVERAWVYASLMFGAQNVRTGHVLVALLKTDFLSQELLKISPRFKQIPEAALSENFAQLVSHRYIPARQLPDKAISLLDTACARVAVSQHAMPAPIELIQNKLQALSTEHAALLKESTFGREHAAQLAEIELTSSQLNSDLDQLQSQWQQEKRILDSMLTLRNQIDQANTESNLAHLQLLECEIKALQGETPLIHPQVDAQCVAAVVADWTGIPVGRMVRNEIENVLNLSNSLGARIVGQRHALETIARRIQTSRAGLDDPNKPVGVFMLAGTSGVGKTETALALAENLYGGEHNVITINMSEYQEAHTVSSLKGAPPGYVGYGEGGVLTEAVRRKPHSVVLLDEVEKAHPDVHELFFQVFDKGWMEDGEGRRIDFRNTLILLTTNVGTAELMAHSKTGLRTGDMPHPEELVRVLRAPMLRVFPPALLGRLEVVPYYPLSSDMLANIVRLQLNRIQQRIASTHQIAVHIDPSVIDRIVARCN